MFEGLLDECVGLTDAELDERLRANELAGRRLAAERAALVAVIEHRGSFRDEHRTMSGYLRATLNASSAAASQDRKLARLLSDHPLVGEEVLAGHVSVDHARQIERIHANPRIRDVLPVVVEVFVDLAEHTSHREFAAEIDQFIQLVDQDGAFADLASAGEGRSASVCDVGGTVGMSASGGGPVDAAQMVAVFEAFVEGEFRRDVDARRAEFGDDAESHPLPRTSAQRRFDALTAIFAAAAASPDGRALPEPTVHIVIDDQTAHETLAHAGIVLPNGNQIDLDDDGAIADPGELLGGLVDELADHPEAFLDRRCETSTGVKIHPSVVLRSLLTGHVRRVVVDSQGTVIDYGTKQRLFTGAARNAAMLLADVCSHPGCETPARFCQVDHDLEWSDGGRTDQRNARITCGHDNRNKHRKRWRTRRDQRGRPYTVRPDGSIILAVGERPPDLAIDQLNEAIRTRAAALGVRAGR